MFRRLKRDLGVIDFGDQIELAMRIATTHPEVGQEYRDRFGAVLLDEYQDRNVAQARLMEALFGGGHPVTAVGDPDQNIYAWRGAALSNLLDFPTVFSCSDGSPAPRLPLFTNFRSGARILSAADTVIGPLPANQRPDPEKRLVPFPPNGEGEVTVASHRDELTEAQWVADRIVALHDDGARWSRSPCCAARRGCSSCCSKPSPNGTSRSRSWVGAWASAALRCPEVVEVLAYARAANDDGQRGLARILGPRYRVGSADLALVAGGPRARTTSGERKVATTRTRRSCSPRH